MFDDVCKATGAACLVIAHTSKEAAKSERLVEPPSPLVGVGPVRMCGSFACRQVFRQVAHVFAQQHSLCEQP